MRYEVIERAELQFSIEEAVLRYVDGDIIHSNNVPYMMEDIEKLLETYTITQKEN